jgi:hypothetical protein
MTTYRVTVKVLSGPLKGNQVVDYWKSKFDCQLKPGRKYQGLNFRYEVISVEAVDRFIDLGTVRAVRQTKS